MGLSSDEEGDLDDLDDGLEAPDMSEDDLDAQTTPVSESSKMKDRTNRVPRVVQEKLADDDAEIEKFERKLGIKKGRKSLPQIFKEDGLDDLLAGIGVESDEGSQDGSRKRMSEYDDWLESKRRKANPEPRGSGETGGTDSEDAAEDGLGSVEDDDSAADGIDDDADGLEYSERDAEEDDFEGFGSDVDAAMEQQPRKRENPYVAPTTGVVVSKYVPPSLRKAGGPEEEAKGRLQKQAQGLINRLTDANVLSIVQSAEELYQNNARGAVTEILTDTVLAQLSKPESLPDQFFVLTGGFAAALYKIIGVSFGSHLIRRVVTDFGTEYERACSGPEEQSSIPKESSNLIALLVQLYAFEVVSSRIIFDYMERLLGDLTELNVELLLRICRMSGRLLRRDDPQALKHVSTVLNKSVSSVGYSNTAVRTKFMIETINDLKNNKPKARGMDSGIVSEHVLRMKKRLGELKSQSRRLDGMAPMGVGLEDIEGAESKGKWWLVGASVPAKAGGPETSQGARKAQSASTLDEATDDEDMDIVLPDYPNKARAQGLSTTAQIAIFTALMSAANYEQGYRQFLNLRLKKDDQVEVARVLVQCVGSEAQYNPYYSLVARQACTNSKIRFAFQDRLWKILRGLGEALFGEEAEDEETADSERMKDERRIGNVARLYASLVVDGALNLSILKPLELHKVNAWTSLFVEWLIVSLLQECRGKGPDEDAKVNKVFGQVGDFPVVAAGLQWFMRKRVRKTKVIGSKELRRLERVREKAEAAILGGPIEA